MKVKVAIIGCGSITEYRHAPEYANNPHAEIAAFYDPNRERALYMASKFGGRAATDLEEILEDERIDAISDCSTNEMHHIITSSALRHGKHVLCEKPMSITLEGAEQVIQAFRESGKILMIDHNQRLTKAHRKVREIIRSGEFGRVLTFKTNFGHKGPEYWSANKSASTWFFKKDRSAFGVAGDLGIHKLDLIRYLLDDEVGMISAFEGALHKKDENGNPIEVCDNMVCMIRMRSGALGTASFSWTYYGEEDNSTTLYCERGVIKIYASAEHQIEIAGIDGEKRNYVIEPIQTNDNQSNSGVIDAFISSIVENRSPLVTGEDGLRALQLVLAAQESATKNVAIEM